jgi:hypothetical protein
VHIHGLECIRQPPQDIPSGMAWAAQLPPQGLSWADSWQARHYLVSRAVQFRNRGIKIACLLHVYGGCL